MVTYFEVWYLLVLVYHLFLVFLTFYHILLYLLPDLLYSFNSLLSFFLANLFVLRQTFIKRLIIKESPGYVAAINKKKKKIILFYWEEQLL